MPKHACQHLPSLALSCNFFNWLLNVIAVLRETDVRKKSEEVFDKTEKLND